jgi:hypothetical protein
MYDPVGVGSSDGSVGTVYDDGLRTDVWQPRPFASRNENVISEQLRLMSVPAEVIRQTMRPGIKELFPPVVGYGPKIELTIQDVLQTDRWTPQIRSWVSGTPRIPRRVDTQDDFWSGTLRGFNASPNMMG